jgi:hypothetical protein
MTRFRTTRGSNSFTKYKAEELALQLRKRSDIKSIKVVKMKTRGYGSGVNYGQYAVYYYK